MKEKMSQLSLGGIEPRTPAIRTPFQCRLEIPPPLERSKEALSSPATTAIFSYFSLALLYTRLIEKGSSSLNVVLTMKC